MLLGRLPIRGKLALLVVVPLLSMVALAVPVVVDRVAAAARADGTARTVRVANRVGTLVQDLQQERLLSVGYLLGTVDRTELVRKSVDVGDRIADVRAEFAGELTARIRAALDDVPKLTDLRAAVLDRRATPDQVIAAFGPIDTALIDSLRLQFDVDTRTTAGRQVLALDALLRTDEGVSVGATLMLLVVATRSEQASAAYVANLARLQVNSQRFRSLATPAQYQLALLEEAAVAARTSRDFLTTGAVDPLKAIAGIDLRTLFPAVASMITLGQFVEKKVAADVITEVTGEQRRALAAAYFVGAGALLILALVVGMSVLVARAVSRPLIRLTRSADRVARLAEAELTRVADDESESAGTLRLDPIDVRAGDEVGDLARAFERVQGTAARLVERQVFSRRNVAQMFGHVGRRTENLVARQLALVDRLERQETDPGRLQHLYRLDHVTSRLRRSASSLVVLSGSAGADEHVAPAPLATVVRLALGEIEDYPRVDVRVESEIMVAPVVIGDLVLALAELMENATSFSPPHTRVTVVGERIPGGARLTLIDHGIGMSAERLAEENARLTRRERLDLAPTEVLGLFVVGRLARRHGWRIALAVTPGGGVTVVVELADHLLASSRSEPPAVTTVPPAEVRTAVASAPAAEGSPATGAGTRIAAGVGSIAGRWGIGPDVMDRAIRSLDGQTWNAFATATRTAGPRPGDSPGAGATAPADSPTAVGTATTDNLGADAGTAPADGPASPTPARGTASVRPGRPPLRQRVPGSHLPARQPGGAADHPVRTGREATPDPVAARALVEEFEAGVRRAHQATRGRSAPDSPASTPTPENSPGGQPPPNETCPNDKNGNEPARLTRRVPGSSLDAPTPRVRRSPATVRPADPDEVRHLMTQFEDGVTRALDEISSAARDEEGPTR